MTEQAYETIQLAHEVLDVLRVEIGATAINYTKEEDFLRGTLKRLKSILNNPNNYLESWYYLDTVDSKRFAAGIRDLIDHVEKTLNTPQNQRGKTALQ